MPESKRQLKVFLSYASQDRPAVRELSGRLVSEGWIDPWVDEKKLLPGQDWRTKIEEAVETSDAVIICLSNNSVTKEGFVQKELRYAREISFEKPDNTIFLIPVRLDECEVPRGLRFYQWVDYFGENTDKSFDALVESLKLRYEQKLYLEEIAHSRREKERLEREAVQKAEQEKLEREALERTERERLEREVWEKATRERLELEAAERLAQEKAKRDAAEKLKRERAERHVAQIAVLRGNIFKYFAALKLTLSKVVPFLRIAGFMGITIVFFWVGSYVISKFIPFVLTPQSTSTQHPAIQTPTTNSFSTETPTPNVIPTKALTFTITPTRKPTSSIPLPTERDANNISMVLVPAGDFTMGNDNGDPFDRPAHKVDLDAFYIDKYEVTNEHYKNCVDAQVCQPPIQSSSMKNLIYYGNTKFKDYPVTWVDWIMAKTYCEWRGARLPTEAEWEKAARGPDGREFPWQNTGIIIDNTFANYGNLVGDFSVVGSYNKGKSPYGAYDMAGNVFEWVSDWFSWDYYSTSPYLNPLGPKTGDYHVYRGGSVISDPAFVRSSSRQWLDPSVSNITLGIGIRCARDVTP